MQFANQILFSSLEFVYLEMQYWAASISSLSVLAFFLWHYLRQSPSSEISKYVKYGSLLVLYLMTYSMSFFLKTDGGNIQVLFGVKKLY